MKNTAISPGSSAGPMRSWPASCSTAPLAAGRRVVRTRYELPSARTVTRCAASVPTGIRAKMSLS